LRFLEPVGGVESRALASLRFKRPKEEIIRLKDEGRVLMRFNKLRETLQLRPSGEFKRFADEELRAALTLLAGPGVVWELTFGSGVLLQPRRGHRRRAAEERSLHPSHPHGRGDRANRCVALRLRSQSC